MDFEFALATRVIFGRGSIRQIGKRIVSPQKKVFIVTGSTKKRAQVLLRHLDDNGLDVEIFNVEREPTTDMVVAGVEKAREYGPDVVIGIGGGSVIDTGKAVSALLTNRGEIMDFLEVIGRGKKLKNPSFPFIAIPTTAGTGCEVTCNAVIKHEKRNVKVSLKSTGMYPELAIIDPELMVSMPPHVTASTGIDALTQLIEAYTSVKANILTDGICKEGLKCAGRSLTVAFKNGENISAREDMAVAALCSGIALANAKLGAVHGFAGPMGGMYPMQHGNICAGLLSQVIRMNIKTLQDRCPNSHVLDRYDEIAGILTGDYNARAAQGINWIQTLCGNLNIPSLQKLGIQDTDIPIIVAKAQKASSMKGNPVQLTVKELTEILTEAL